MFFVAVALVSLLFAIWWYILPPTYFTNDDVLIRLLLEGRAVPQQPATGFITTAHSALGWALVWLRAHTGVAFVWDWTLTIVVILGLGTVFTVAWRTKERWAVRILALLVIVIALTRVITGLQFTLSSSIAGGAAVALALRELTGDRPARSWVLIVSSVLMTAGLLVRILGAAAGAAASGTVFVLTSWMIGTLSRRHLMRCAVVGAAAIVLYAVALCGDAYIYRSSAPWRAAYQNHARISVLFDWAGGISDDDVAAMRASAGWTANDFELLREWWGVDPDLHGPARVGDAYETYRKRRAPAASPFFGLLLRPFNLASTVDTLKQSVPTLLAIAVLLLGIAPRRRVAAAATTVLGIIALYVVVQLLFKDLPWYLVDGMNVCVAGGVAAAPRAPAPSSRVVHVGLATTVLLVAFAARSAAVYQAAEERQVGEIDRQIDEVQQLHPSLVIAHADSFPLEYWQRPFRNPAVPLPVIILSFDNQNPLLQQFLTSTHRQPLLRTICQDPSVIVVSEEGRLNPVTAYWAERVGRPVRWMQLFSGTFRAWRCVQQDAPPGRSAGALQRKQGNPNGG